MSTKVSGRKKKSQEATYLTETFMGYAALKNVHDGDLTRTFKRILQDTKILAEV
jgi:ribosomal protein S21